MKSVVYRQWFAILVMALLASGCASKGEIRDESDPWEGFNRSIYTFNDTLDRYAMKPIAKGYRAITPDIVEVGINNFFSNLNDVSVIVNGLLQAKPRQAASDTGRLVLNTTVGLLGILDVGTVAGLVKHEEDFGQTLAVWGVASGPYVVLPLFGPSTVRDGLALIPDSWLDPVLWINHIPTRNQLYVLRLINKRAGLLTASKVLDEAALDPYTFLRDGYLQRRQYLIYDGDPPLDYDEFDDEFYEDEFEEDEDGEGTPADSEPPAEFPDRDGAAPLQRENPSGE